MNLHRLFTSALEASWQGSLAIFFILALRPLLGGRIPAGWRSLLWTLALIRLLVPASMLPESPASMQNIAGAEQSVQRVRLVWTAGQTAEPETAIAASPVTNTAISESSVDWWKLAAQVWLGGTCILGAWLFGGAISLRRRLARENTEVDETVARVWRACCERAAVRRPPRLIATDAITSPALVGIIRPTLLLPRRFHAELSREDCEHIFLHELAHYRRRDHWTHLVQLCALCIHWFNPLVWFGCRYLRADRELAADEWALRHLASDRSAAYGETLLRLLSAQNAPAFPRSAIGILEDGAQIKQRLRRIVAFRPRRRAGSLAGLALVAGMAAMILTAAESPVGSLKGWSVVSVAIPKNGDIRDAYVELKSPAGRVVTLTGGVTTQEGVTLEKLEWSGAPIRAVVTLRKGSERAELSAEASLISKNNELSRRSVQVEIESKFIEIPEAAAKELIFPSQTSFMDKFPGTPPPRGAARSLGLETVLNEADAEALLRKLNALKGADILSAPRVTTRSQQRAVIEIIREFRYPTEYDRKPGQPVTPTAFETRNCGVTLEVEPVLGEGGMIDLKLTPELTEFLGFISYPSGETIPVTREPGEKLHDRLGALKLPDKPYAPDEIRQPVFSTRKTTAQLTVVSGQTVVFLGGSEAEPMPGFELPSAGKRLLVLVRASFIKPDEASSVRPDASPAVSTAPASDIPAGTAVPGKPGFVTSPHAHKAGYIDVRGFVEGTEVKCPYSGKTFRVPAPSAADKSGAFSPAPFLLEGSPEKAAANVVNGNYEIREPLPVRRLDGPGPGYREQQSKVLNK
jgi:bla regulator protein BlaR1